VSDPRSPLVALALDAILCGVLFSQVATSLIDDSEPMLRKLSRKNASRAAAAEAAPGGKVQANIEPEAEEDSQQPLWGSNDPAMCECG